MKVPKMDNYLFGRKFHDGKPFMFEGIGVPMHRDELLLEKLFTKKSTIVHVGACDHLPLIDEKIKKHTWMHALIMENADRVCGIDINRGAVSYCRSIGYDNIFYADLANNPSGTREILSEYGGVLSNDTAWEYIFLGEVLEHQDDPVHFLRCIRDNYGDMIKKIVVTVPHAFKYSNFRNALHGVEAINTDHRYWFTPYTICKVFAAAGIEPLDIYLSDCSFGRARKLIQKIFPNHMFYGDLILVGELS